MAYVPQEAWVQNTSVAENVCFRQELNLSWLERVLEACALWPDVGSFPAGVHTQIGEQVRAGLLGTGRHYVWGHLLLSLSCGQCGERDKGETRRAGKWERKRAQLRATHIRGAQ